MKKYIILILVFILSFTAISTGCEKQKEDRKQNVRLVNSFTTACSYYIA